MRYAIGMSFQQRIALAVYHFIGFLVGAVVFVALLPLILLLVVAGQIGRAWRWLELHAVYQGDEMKRAKDEWRHS